jgi:deoxyhypusine synthase
VTWGKIDPEQLPDTVVCYCDSTIAWPIMTSYALSVGCKREPKRLYDRRFEMIEHLRQAYVANRVVEPAMDGSTEE